MVPLVTRETRLMILSLHFERSNRVLLLWPLRRQLTIFPAHSAEAPTRDTVDSKKDITEFPNLQSFHGPVFSSRSYYPRRDTRHSLLVIVNKIVEGPYNIRLGPDWCHSRRYFVASKRGERKVLSDGRRTDDRLLHPRPHCFP